MPKLRAVHEDPTLRISGCENLLLAVWSNAPDLAQMRAMGAALRGLARSQPAGSALMNIVVRGTPNFTEPVRTEALRLSRDPTISRLGGAHVILLSGLAGVATRAFLSTVTLVASQATPTRIFGDGKAAAAWLAERLAEGPAPHLSEADVLDAFEQTIAGR